MGKKRKRNAFHSFLFFIPRKQKTFCELVLFTLDIFENQFVNGILFPQGSFSFFISRRRENALNLHPIIRKISLKHTKHTKNTVPTS